MSGILSHIVHITPSVLQNRTNHHTSDNAYWRMFHYLLLDSWRRSLINFEEHFIKGFEEMVKLWPLYRTWNWKRLKLKDVLKGKRTPWLMLDCTWKLWETCSTRSTLLQASNWMSEFSSKAGIIVNQKAFVLQQVLLGLSQIYRIVFTDSKHEEIVAGPYEGKCLLIDNVGCKDA